MPSILPGKKLHFKTEFSDAKDIDLRVSVFRLRTLGNFSFKEIGKRLVIKEKRARDICYRIQAWLVEDMLYMNGQSLPKDILDKIEEIERGPEIFRRRWIEKQSNVEISKGIGMSTYEISHTVEKILWRLVSYLQDGKSMHASYKSLSGVVDRLAGQKE